MLEVETIKPRLADSPVALSLTLVSIVRSFNKVLPILDESLRLNEVSW